MSHYFVERLVCESESTLNRFYCFCTCEATARDDNRQKLDKILAMMNFAYIYPVDMTVTMIIMEKTSLK